MSKIIVKTGISSTTKSAASKKSRMLKQLREAGMKLAVAKAIRNADQLLAECCTEEELTAAANGLTPTRGGKNSITLEVEIDDEPKAD